MGDHDDVPVVLELRVHGVANTSPADMLGLAPAGIEQVEGDDLGSFWRPAAGAAAAAPGSAGYVPPRVQREAYSWGGLARTTVAAGGTGQVGRAVAALGRIGWTLLLPFGLTNVAYWTRPLTVPPVPGSERSEPAATATRHGPRPGQGAGTIRLFGLLLTLLLVTTACEVGMDLVGTQCFAGRQARCTNLPSLLDVFRDWGVGPRMAVFSVVPVLLLVGLWQLTRISANRYEAAAIGHARHDAGGAIEGSALPPTWLRSETFWDGRRAVGRLTAMHVAGGLALVTLASAWPALFAVGRGPRSEACRSPRLVLTQGCWTQVEQAPTGQWVAFAAVAALALVVLAGAGIAVVGLSGDAPDLPAPGRTARRAAGGLLVVAALTLVAEVVLLLTLRPQVQRPAGDGPFLVGASAVPVALTALLLGLAAGGLALRAWRTGWCLLGALALAVLLVAPAFGTSAAVRAGALAGAALVLLVLAVRPGAPLGGRDATMWGGRAPGVFMLLALAVAASLSSIVVLTVGDWLNGGRGAADLLAAAPATDPACARSSASCAGPHLGVAAPYAWAGVVSIGFVVLLVVGATILWFGRGGPVTAWPVRLGARHAPFAGVAVRRGGQVDDLRRMQRIATTYTEPPGSGRDAVTELERSLLLGAVTARRTAGYAHRAERLAALCAVASTLAVAGAVALSVTYPTPPRWLNGPLDGGVAVLTLLGVTIIGAVGGGVATRDRRPLGLAFDLICFLPRSGHALGPPCYAERAVPEIVRRVEWWLDGEKADGSPEPGAGRRHVVLSAHSLGAVLTVAAVCTLSARESAAASLARTRLITYGVQLRPYFGRLFPELLGPSVLGTNPVTAPAWTRAHPWRRTRQVSPSAPRPGTVRGLLGGRWVNLWRLTDPIGFPADAYTEEATAMDRAAEEFDASTYVVRVDGHGDYPRSLVYLDVLEQAVAEVPPPSPWWKVWGG